MSTLIGIPPKLSPNARVVSAFHIGRRDENEGQLDGWGCELPLGSEPLGVFMDGSGQLAVNVLVRPNTPRVWCPFIVAPNNMPIGPALGRSLGESVGMVGVPAQQGVQLFHVFKDEPWPKSALEAVAAGSA